MIEIILLSTAAAISGVITFTRMFKFKTLVKYRFISDVLFTVALLSVFGGTLSGALICAIAGLMFSMMLGAGHMTVYVREKIRLP